MSREFCLIFLILGLRVVGGDGCNQKVFENGNVVCVCDSEYCDKVPSLQGQATGIYQIYRTSKAELGFKREEGILDEVFQNHTSSGGIIRLDFNTKYQSIIGFGGAFTDSAGINILSLPQKAQNNLLNSYFGDDGVGYSLCRVPIGGTDFSVRPYTYDDNPGDEHLEKFALQEEDYKYKIPLIKKAFQLRGDKPLKLFGSSWSAPPWMKTNNNYAGIAFLKGEYYQLWTDYLMKFFDEYETNGVKFWGMTTQNEPESGFAPRILSKINSMGWTPRSFNTWIGKYLGPTLRASQHKDMKLILLDGNRIVLPLLYFLTHNNMTMSYADGVATHWYLDGVLPWFLLDFTKTNKKDWFLFSSEACTGALNVLGLEKSVDLGSWKRGEQYTNSIFSYLEHGASGWVDWNMVLNTDGGPSYIDNSADSPIIANSSSGEFYKQPMYYHLGHFAKFVIPDSERVKSSVKGLDGVRVVAFQRPDNLTAVVIYNSNSKDVHLKIMDSNSQSASLGIQANSINTLLY